MTKRFIDARLAAGLDHFRLHDLRHFMATQMLDEGVPVPIVAARLAHARASTTLNVYAHAVPVGTDVPQRCCGSASRMPRATPRVVRQPRRYHTHSGCDVLAQVGGDRLSGREFMMLSPW